MQSQLMVYNLCPLSIIIIMGDLIQNFHIFHNQLLSSFTQPHQKQHTPPLISKQNYEHLIYFILKITSQSNLNKKVQALSKIYVDKFLLADGLLNQDNLKSISYATVLVAVKETQSNADQIIASIKKNNPAECIEVSVNKYIQQINIILNSQSDFVTPFCYLESLVTKAESPLNESTVHQLQTIIQFSFLQQELIGIPANSIFLGCVLYFIADFENSHSILELGFSAVEPLMAQAYRVKNVLLKAVENQ